MSETIN